MLNSSQKHKLIMESKYISKERYISPKYVYHCAKEEFLDSIFTFGFERYFFNRGVGNMYGPGAYTTFDLISSITNAKRGEYGRIIVKFEVLNGYNKGLIWDNILAKQVYGENWKIADQMRLLFPREVINEMKNTKYSEGSVYSYLTMRAEYTSNLAFLFYSLYGNKNMKLNPYHMVDSLTFNGRRDGNVSVMKDAKSIMPIEYSKDLGKTWINGRTDKTDRYTKNDFDAGYHFGKRYDKTDVTEYG